MKLRSKKQYKSHRSLHARWFFLFVISLVFAFLSTLLLQMPIINIPFVIVSLPVFELLPEFNNTGKHVDWNFFGPTLSSLYSWVVFFIYYWLLGLPLYIFYAIKHFWPKENI